MTDTARLTGFSYPAGCKTFIVNAILGYDVLDRTAIKVLDAKLHEVLGNSGTLTRPTAASPTGSA